MENAEATPTQRLRSQRIETRRTIARRMAEQGYGYEDIARRCSLDQQEARAMVMGPK